MKRQITMLSSIGKPDLDLIDGALLVRLFFPLKQMDALRSELAKRQSTEAACDGISPFTDEEMQ